MTATATPSAPRAAVAPVAPGRATPRFHIPAEVALATLTLATVYGFSRVFESGGYWGPMVIVVAYAHASLIALRRKGVGVLPAAGLGTAGLALAIVYGILPGTLRYGLPSGASVGGARDALAHAWQTFQTAQPPAPVEDGFLIAAAVALFFAIFLADWAAFRLWSSWEALVPSTTVFVFCSVLGGTQNRVPSVVVFTSAAVLFLLLHRIARRETGAGWLAADARRGTNAWLRVGGTIGVIGVLAGALLAPRLPGADRGAIFGREGKQGRGDRFTVSPLVEVRSRLTDQQNVEMFTVRAGREAYWRLTALDQFDGNTWRSRGKFVEAEGDLKPPLGAGRHESLNQEYTVTGLARLWLPAAYQPRQVSASAHARYHDESGTLIVDTDYETSDGFTYTVESALPDLDPVQLRKADPKVVDSALRAHYTELPQGWAVTAPALARDIVERAGAKNDYDKARALQDFFQGPDFTYDTSIQPGQSGSAIDEFLKAKRGYCEQFSASFAAMARSLGIPARVAVGFTWGQRDGTDPSLYHVKGEHAHAWPEVYLGEYGWVSFEPTKDRGEPTATAWTGRQPQQFEEPQNDPGGSTTTSKKPGAAGTSVVPGSSTTVGGEGNVQVEDAPTTTIPFDQVDSTGRGLDGVTAAIAGFLLRLGAVLVVLAVLLGLYAAAVMTWLDRDRRRRRALARTPADLVRVAWADAVDHLAMVGAVPDRAETHGEFAARASRLLPDADGPIHELALDTDAATYAEHLLDERVAAHAEASAHAVGAAIDAKVPPLQQWLVRLNPSWVLRRARLPHTHRATSTHIGPAPAG